MRWFEITGYDPIEETLKETTSGCISGGSSSLFVKKVFPKDRYWPYPKKSESNKKQKK